MPSSATVSILIAATAAALVMLTAWLRSRRRIRALEQQLADALYRDRLTGLANRTLFMQQLRESIERVRLGRQKMFAVLVLDFDRFKLVNDVLGHEAGDELLLQMAGRLRQSLRGPATQRGPAMQVARFGGDEFLLL